MPDQPRLHQSGPKPSIPHRHPWTDGNGVSHQRQCALAGFEIKGVGAAVPQRNKHERSEATVAVTVQPVGWNCPRPCVGLTHATAACG